MAFSTIFERNNQTFSIKQGRQKYIFYKQKQNYYIARIFIFVFLIVFFKLLFFCHFFSKMLEKSQDITKNSTKNNVAENLAKNSHFFINKNLKNKKIILFF